MGKHNRRLDVICFAVMVGLAPAALFATSEWQLVHSSDRLTVERRDYKGSELDEIRGVLRLDASLNAIMALLKDASFNEQWVYRSGGARVLKEMGYPQAYVYGIVDAPFPMVDRDTVVRFDFEQNPVTREITIGITNFPQFAPEADGLVRVPDFGGFWHLRPLTDRGVMVTYQVYGDPGGWIPSWMANRAAVLSVQNTLENMQAAVAYYERSESRYVKELDTAE
ncbi:MAG: hypothetical protein P8L39_05255 [Halioglobus sp.]|nr:hypothetical protein [Halioglobus sp.]